MGMRWLMAAFMAPFITACVSSAIAPSAEQVATTRRIHVVPIEPPPLILPAQYQTKVDAVGLTQVPLALAGGDLSLVRGFGVLNTLLVVVELSRISSRPIGPAPPVPEWHPNASTTEQVKVWVPTVALAREVERQLGDRGVEVSVDRGVRPLPGVAQRGVTALMENWMAPIRSYYNDTKLDSTYASLGSGPTVAVLEVGVMNYEVGPGSHLLVQVFMRLVDPATGRLIGRARAADPVHPVSVDPLEETLANDAAKFKVIFDAATRGLVADALRQLGLAH
jgi:hypothetical protein